MTNAQGDVLRILDHYYNTVARYYYDAWGAALGVAGQLVSDLVKWGIDGEFSFSSPATYIGAAAGGAVVAALPLTGAFMPANEIAKDIVSSVVSTVVSMTTENIYSSITGESEYMYSADQMFVDTINSAIFSGMTSGFSLSSEFITDKLLQKVSDKVFVDNVKNGVWSVTNWLVSGAMNSKITDGFYRPNYRVAKERRFFIK